MMTKAEYVREILAMDPSLGGASISAIQAAVLEQFGAEVSGETVRLQRKAFNAELTADDGDADDPEAEAFDAAYAEPDAGEPQDGQDASDEPAPDEDQPGENEAAVEPQEPAGDASEDEEILSHDAEDVAADAEGEVSPESQASAELDTWTEQAAGDAPQAAAKQEAKVKEENAGAQSVITREPVAGRCNHRMERAGDLCGRPAGHPGIHTTYAQMDKKKKYSKDRAKVRYQTDPDYKARVKAASLASHKKGRQAAKAAREAADAKVAASAAAAAES